mgnify:CR=1 FL=1
MFIIFYDRDNQLLYINSTKKTVSLYQQIAGQYLEETPKQLPLSLVHKVIADLENPELFNLGLRSKNSINNAESYLIKAGSHVQNAIKANEINLYEGGHAFLRGKEHGTYHTIGYSSSSKVWSNTTAKVTNFIKWCLALSEKINSTKEVKTNTDLDRITFRRVITQIPNHPIFASWDGECFKEPFIFYHDRNGVITEGLLTDLDIKLDLSNCNNQQIQFTISNESFSEPYKFTLDKFYEFNSNNFLGLFVVTPDGEQIEMAQFLNDYPITFYFQDFASLRLNEISSRTLSDKLSFSINKVIDIDWSDTDIECEFSGNQAGKLHIHEKIEQYILSKAPSFLLYDHGSGEMADYISIKENASSILIELYHCKGAGGKTTGNRVDDVYELCGQAIKSGLWTNSAVLIDKVQKRLNRTNPSTIIVGDLTELSRLLSINKIFQFRIIAVQPGLLKADIAPNISEILAATESYVENGDAVKFNLMTS